MERSAWRIECVRVFRRCLDVRCRKGRSLRRVLPIRQKCPRDARGEGGLGAYCTVRRELSQRYDLKGSGAEVALDKQAKRLTVSAPSDFVSKQVIDVISSKLVKRGVDLGAVAWGAPQPAAGQSVRVFGDIVDGIDKEFARTISKDIRDSKIKAKVAIEGDKLRVTSSSKDALQDVIAYLKGKSYDQPIQFTNYR